MTKPTYKTEALLELLQLSDLPLMSCACHQFGREHVRFGERSNQRDAKAQESSQAELAMIYKPMEATGLKWRKLTEAHLAVLVRAVVRFVNGELVKGREQDNKAA